MSSSSYTLLPIHTLEYAQDQYRNLVVHSSCVRCSQQLMLIVPPIDVNSDRQLPWWGLERIRLFYECEHCTFLKSCFHCVVTTMNMSLNAYPTNFHSPIIQALLSQRQQKNALSDNPEESKQQWEISTVYEAAKTLIDLSTTAATTTPSKEDTTIS